MKFSFKVLLLIFCITPVFAQELLFKSGFEGNITLGTPGGEQYIRGIDSITGFTWPIILGGGESGYLHHIPESLAGNDSYAEFVNIEGHNGMLTRALHKKFYGRPGIPGYSQCGYQILPKDTTGNELYISWWEKIPKAPLDWRTVWFWKTPGEPAGERIEAYIYNGKDTGPYWHVHQDGGAWGGYQVFNFDIDNHDVPVPFNEWFQHKVYWKRSTGEDGRLVWKINYKNKDYTIADYTGVTQKDTQNINQVTWAHIYGMTEGETYEHWIDDVEIWTSTPPKPVSVSYEKQYSRQQRVYQNTLNSMSNGARIYDMAGRELTLSRFGANASIPYCIFSVKPSHSVFVR